MKRLFAGILAFFSFFLIFDSDGFAVSAAFTQPSAIRVGLSSKYAGLSSVNIKNESIMCGLEVNGFFYGECSLNSPDGFTVSPGSGYYVKSGVYSSYRDAFSYASNLNAMGYTAAPCLVSYGNWTVYTGPYDTEQQALNASASLYGTVAAPSGKAVLLKAQNKALVIFDSQSSFPQFADAGGKVVSLGDRKYRGRIEMMRVSGGITAVNVLTIEEYLYGAVPSEAASGWHMEALKAQAVASRSYIVNRIGNHSAGGYEVCDGTHCQVYLGAGNEAESTTSAVNATAGVYVYYDGEPISAVFFTSSGGTTDNSENVWTYAQPYLRSVTEKNETTGKVWERTFTLDEINRALYSNNANIGQAVGVTIAKTENGRVQELVINGTNGSKSLFKEEIRTFFSSLPGGSLESRNFTIADGTASASGSGVYVTNGRASDKVPVDFYVIGKNGALAHSADVGGTVSTASSASTASYSATAQTVSSISNSSSVTFSGRGYGHGVGMSQHGAQGMAELGYTYDQILKWYYTGVEVRQ